MEPSSVQPAEHSPHRTRTARKRRAVQLLGVAGLIYVLWCSGLYLAQDSMLFHPDLAGGLGPGQLEWLQSGERLTRALDSGGTVEAYFFPAPRATAGGPRPVVVFLHGNAELAGHQSWTVQQYHALGCSVLLPEYRGYGSAGGKPSEQFIVADAVRFLDQVLKRPEVDRARIILHGRSLGGGVAAQVAVQRRPTALILESTFTSIAGMAHDYGVPEWLVRHPFRTDRVLPALDVPVLIGHGTRDGIVPIAQARRNRELAARSRLLEYDCGHSDFPGTGNRSAYWEEIRGFLSENRIVDASDR